MTFAGHYPLGEGDLVVLATDRRERKEKETC